MPLGQRLYRLRELRGVLVSAACERRSSTTSPPSAIGVRHDDLALPAHVAGLGFERGARGCGDADRRARRTRRALARRLRARLSLEPADSVWRRAARRLRHGALHHALRLRRVMPTWRCSATRSCGRGGRFRCRFCSRCCSSRSSTCCLQIGVLGVVPWQSLLDAHGQPTAAGAIRRRARRRTDMGPCRRLRGNAARSGHRVRLALRQSVGILAHLVCRGARRRVFAGVCASFTHERRFRTSRSWPSARCRWSRASSRSTK